MFVPLMSMLRLMPMLNFQVIMRIVLIPPAVILSLTLMVEVIPTLLVMSDVML